MPGPQTGRHKQFWMISPVPSSIDLSTPPTRPLSKGHFTPQPERSDYPGNGERTFDLVPIVTMSFHPWDSNAKKKTNQIPRNKTLPFLVCLASKLRGNQPQAQVAPNSQRTYSTNPPKPMSHLFVAQVHLPSHMRTF
ncbi:hypothetical protein O181_069194 [Austropuccinia psidii MF-1]|uniref:Uncharacterized protein n=1 Tax=Austropuccinia psidii MF-1 TaxID=1389203 RepID=A0A9Q3I8A5_9BASI|nr:hypothetical protein [Austropuccinia psidii MF-1]